MELDCVQAALPDQTSATESRARLRQRQPLHAPDAETVSALPKECPDEKQSLQHLAHMLALETEIRQAASEKDLYLLLANRLPDLTPVSQVFVFRMAGSLRVAAISGQVDVNRHAPLIEDVERRLKQEMRDQPLKDALFFEMASHRYPCFFWQPMVSRDGRLVGGFLLAQAKPWPRKDADTVAHIAEASAHALTFLCDLKKGPTLRGWLRQRRNKVMAALIGCLCLALLIPVPMSVMAPLEVAARDPFVVAAPLDGVIEEVLVDPGDQVEANQPLVRLGGIELRNKLSVAQEQFQVAEARLRSATQMAFDNEKGRNELRLAMADLNLKRAEMAFARDLYNQSVLRAERSGVAVLSDKQALSGKPVVTGERLMQIADPSKVKLVIHLPVSDAIILQPDAKVKVFLDSDPMHSHPARIRYSDYQALPVNGDQLAFRLIADLDADSKVTPRLGVRGTAQIFGDRTLLGFYLFRRPLSFARQWIGL